jgi:hypothetical protein
VKLAPPGLAGGPPFRAREEVLERHVQKGAARLGQDLALETEIAVDVDAPSAALGDPGRDAKVAADQHRPAVPNEDPGGDRGEAVPGGEEAARLVECRADEPAVDDAGRRLVPLAEGEARLVALDPFLRRERKADPVRVVPAPPTRRIVMGRNVYRRPPRSKCAL